MMVKSRKKGLLTLNFLCFYVFTGVSSSLASQVKDPGPLLNPSSSANAWQHTRKNFDTCKASFAPALASADTLQEIKAVRNISNNHCSCLVNKMAEVWDVYGREQMPTLMRLMRNGGKDIDDFNSYCKIKYIDPYAKPKSSSASPSQPEATPGSTKSVLNLVPAPSPTNKYPLDCNKQANKSLFDKCMQNI